MKVYGRASLHEFLGDFVVFRNLIPLDSRLPNLEEIREVTDLSGDGIPRKGGADHARVVVHLLRAAHDLVAPGRPIKQLIYVGDTRTSDGKAFTHIAAEGRWPGFAFIADESGAPPSVEIEARQGINLYFTNRWGALAAFEWYCRRHGCSFDESTAVILDLDKTALGARGRNDGVINQARVEAARLTVGSYLGEEFNLLQFQRIYDLFNTQAFHYFTADNQDYLAYICLILSNKAFELEPVISRLQGGGLKTFEQFIAEVETKSGELPSFLREVHDRVYARVKAGDPTPFKAFRKREYQATVSRMGSMGEEASARDLLAGEIVITQEVREAAHRWKERGALLFGLSDKPYEASIPGNELVLRGYKPIHKVETHAVGEQRKEREV